jgi:hypothetical protein
METIGDLHWKIACLSVQKKILVLLLNTEKDRLDKRDFWEMFTNMEDNMPPSRHSKADEALTELSVLLDNWEICRTNTKRSMLYLGGLGEETIEEGDEEPGSDFHIAPKKFPRRRGIVCGDRRKDTATVAPVLDENPLDVAERIVSAVKIKKNVPKKDATALRLVHQCVRDVDMSRYTHTVRVHYAVFVSRPGIEDDVLHECLTGVDAFLVWLGRQRVPESIQKVSPELQQKNIDDAINLSRRCRPIHPQRRFMEVFDAVQMAQSMCSPLLTFLPIHEIFKMHLEYEIPDLSPVAHFEGVEGTFFTALRVDRTEVLWRADPGLCITAKKMSTILILYLKDLFVECVDRAYPVESNGRGIVDSCAYLDFDTRCDFVGPRLKIMMQNVVLCTPRGIQEILQCIIGRQKARKVSRVDRWCEISENKFSSSNEIEDVVQVVKQMLRSTTSVAIRSVLERFSPWIQKNDVL